MPKPTTSTARRGGAWGHLLVGLSACVLTVSIVGSAVYLSTRLYDRYETKRRAKAFVAALENRTPEELRENIDQLLARPRLARYLVPELLACMRTSRSERQLTAAIDVSHAFAGSRSVQKTLFDLHRHGNESVAAGAVGALSRVQPPEKSAELLGQCLDVASSSYAVADEVCAGLYRLGDVGRAEMAKHLAELTPQRRVWLVGYVQTAAGDQRTEWLKMLQADAEPSVRAAAEKALAGIKDPPNPAGA